MVAERPRATNVPLLSHLQTNAEWADWTAVPAVLDDDGWRVILDTSLDRWDVHVDRAHQRTFIHPDLWATLQEWGPAMQAFVDEHVWTEADVARRFIVADAGPYGEAARREAERKGTATPLGKDRMLDLAERAHALIIQAVSLNASPTEGQQRIFAVRMAELREEYALMEAEMVKIRGMLDLATAALVDASR